MREITIDQVNVRNEDLRGRKFKVLANPNSHNYPLNTILTFRDNITIINRAGADQKVVSDAAVEVFGGNNLRLNTIVLLTGETKEDLQESINKLQSEINKCQEKVDFMNEHGLEEYDEDFHEALVIMDSLENDTLTRSEKAKQVLKLIKSK